MAKNVAEWSAKIRASWVDKGVVASVVATGTLLLECKAELGHGKYLKEAIAGSGLELIRVAQMFTKIASHKVLANASNYSLLPDAYNTLYALSGLEIPVLEKAILDGRVTPTLKLDEAKALVRRLELEANSDGPHPPANTPTKAWMLPEDLKPYYSDEYTTVILGDTREVLPRLTADTVHLVLGDPPYIKECEYLWAVITKESARLLTDGCSLVTLLGHHQLPFVMDEMRQHVDFHWIGGMGHANAITPLHGVRVGVSWKPALWFTKGTTPTVTDGSTRLTSVTASKTRASTSGDSPWSGLRIGLNASRTQPSGYWTPRWAQIPPWPRRSWAGDPSV